MRRAQEVKLCRGHCLVFVFWTNQHVLCSVCQWNIYFFKMIITRVLTELFSLQRLKFYTKFLHLNKDWHLYMHGWTEINTALKPPKNCWYMSYMLSWWKNGPNISWKFLWHILNAWFLLYMSHKTHLIQLGSWSISYPVKRCQCKGCLIV